MQNDRTSGGLYPAQLRFWRHRRGLSQLDLSLAAQVSSRHISFLETGRSRPSRDMVLRLASALALSIRVQNEMLQVAGHRPRFEDPDKGLLSAEVQQVVAKLIAHQDPWPVMVLDRYYNLITANRVAELMIPRLVADSGALQLPLNVGDLLFDPKLSRPFVVGWQSLAARILARLHQSALLAGEDDGLRVLIDRLLAYPDVPVDWRLPDFTQSTRPLLSLELRLADNTQLCFMTTITTFSDPQRRTLEELQIETYIPMDAATEAFVRGL